MKITTEKFAVFSRGYDALSLNANAAWPTLNLAGHVVVRGTALRQLNRILTNLQ